MDITLKVDASAAIDAVAVTKALAELVAFVDGLTYAQLDHVPGLFAAARKARMALPDDQIAAELRDAGR